jgi:adenine/guanine phosphoribosyltransferase-like PRPP-binding protein
VLPTSTRAKKLRKALSKMVKLDVEVMKKLRFDEQGYFDNTNIIFNMNLLKLAAQHALDKFAGKKITVVLTAAVDGIPLATLVANLLNKNVVVAKKEKEVGVRSFLEEVYIPSNSAILTSLYIPKKLPIDKSTLTIRRGDSVLIVDDVIRSGETQRALINLCYKAKAEVAGIFALIVVGTQWKGKIPELIPVEYIYSIK